MKVVVWNSISLDGVMQSPARADEDRRGGFEHGGWAVPYSDAAMGRIAGQSMAAGGALLLGRRTYEDLFSVWPNRKDGNPYTDALNNALKYVASRRLKEPLPWSNSKLLEGDAADSVVQLKKQPGKDLVILGSGELIHSLMRRQLIDQFTVLIYPLVLGSGRRLFPDGVTTSLRLVDTKTTPAGVVVATYLLAG